MKNHKCVNTISNLTFLILFVFSLYSCSTTSNMVLNIPDDLITNENTIHIKGTKGKGLVGTKRNLVYDKYYTGKLKEGWTKTSDIFDKFPHGFLSKETFERSLYENLGANIDEITSKTSDKFQFTVSDSTQSWIAFCSQMYEGKSTNNNILNSVEFSRGTSQKSHFSVTFISFNDTLTPKWNLELKYSRETPNGIIQTFLNEGMATETGQISNGRDTIQIKPLFVKGRKLSNNQYADIIKIVGGYEFIYNTKTIGVVDLYKHTMSLVTTENKNNSLLTTAATALLLRKR
jgi:hypothetical protein